jgi:xanthine dehydrogenase accessory factor
LHKAGFPVVVLELERPLMVRRRVSVGTAVLEGSITIDGMHAQRADTFSQAQAMADKGLVPVLVSPSLPPTNSPFPIVIDGLMAKRNVDTRIDQAEFVVALGPGFTVGWDCHAVIETMRGHRLGRVIWKGAAIADSGVPGIVQGRGSERVLRAPAAGFVQWNFDIGDMVTAETVVGSVNELPITAPFDGVLRGLIAGETAVKPNMKIGDLDPRGNVENCFTISDKALSIGGGVLEAVLTHLNQQ